MGIIMMESFSRFAQGDFDHLAAGPLRPVQADNEWKEFTGYNNIADAYNGQLNASASYQAVGLYQDPIVASKTRLGLDTKFTASTHNYNHLYGLERNFATAKTKYTAGFLIRFRRGTTFTAGPYTEGYGFEFCATGRTRAGLSTAAQPRYILVGGATNTTGAQAVVSADTCGQSAVAAGSMISVTSAPGTPPTFRLGGVTDPNGVGITLQYDTDHFFEVEVDTVNKTLKIWVDDVYAGLSPWSDLYHAPLANGFQIRLQRMQTTAQGVNADLGGVYLSDIYCIDNTDNVVPNLRLGKTTRVMGEAPDSDISTMFTRPDGYPGNYDVINDPITTNAIPSVYLAGDGAGAEDMYQTTASSIGTFAGTVYGVQIHARFQNASAASHELAITSDDGTKLETSLGNIAAGSGVQMKSIILNNTPSNTAWTPAKAAALKYGFKIVN